jgi:hypothetical protein
MTTMGLLNEPKGWKCLQHMAQQETDPKRLSAILGEMNRLLDRHEKTAGEDSLEAPDSAANSNYSIYSEA